jgi:hypothetical protein
MVRANGSFRARDPDRRTRSYPPDADFDNLPLLGERPATRLRR